MSAITKIEPLAVEAVGIAKEVARLVAQGLNRDQVLERLADPAGVASKLIDSAVERKKAGTAYLGRDPAPVMARVEVDPDADKPKPRGKVKPAKAFKGR